ncbi:lipocalin family protein [Burkholderiaceae bacterium DAT-1]|nr:lipocalin family protein [Burkholderiaceae bacterium DAT-1]
MILAGACLIGMHCNVLATEPVKTVPRVDLSRYLGKWYEIASFPMFFQRQCASDTTATYALLPSGKISVDNECKTSEGKIDHASGTATVEDGTGNAKLKVTFFWPFRGDYWIIGLDPEYRWAVVGNPDRKYLWILSRTPIMPQAMLLEALDTASRQHFEIGRLQYTRQGH